MATKSLQARLINLTPELNSAIRRTHLVFNISLRQMVERYLAMRKGKYGPQCQKLINIMLKHSNTFAHGVMDKLTRPKLSTKLDDEWVKIAKCIVEKDGPLFDQHKGFAIVDGHTIRTSAPHGSGVQKSSDPKYLIVSSKFWHQVCDDASAFLKSFSALLDAWKKERESWLQERLKWQKEHAEFMAFWNGPYRNFEASVEEARLEAQKKAGQKVIAKKRDSRERGQRNERWHLWYEWVLSHPSILAWRGKAAPEDFKTIPPEIKKDILRKFPRQDKHIPKFLDWLRKNNPELEALERVRRTYVRQYLRFRRPPTLTLPSPDSRPRWFSMERNVFYKDSDFEKGRLKLHLIDVDENGIWYLRWFEAFMKCDPRLKPSYRAKAFLAEGRCPPYLDGKPGNKLNRPAPTAAERRAGVAGAKLILKGSSAHLMFTVIDQDSPPRMKWKKVKQRRCGADNAVGPDEQSIPIIVLAIDLGIRHLGGFCVACGERKAERWSVRNIAKGIVKGSGLPALFNLKRHEWQLRSNRRVRGKPVRGERSFIQLQNHRTHMADDRFKKAAHAIVGLARIYDVHVILFENLSTLITTARNERWANRQLRLMNRGHIVNTVTETAKEFGIMCHDRINPWLTSHICSRCCQPGFRFSMKAKNSFREKKPRCDCKDYGYPEWDLGGHLFRCPHCGYRANADVNAAGNIAQKFFGRFPAEGLSRKDLVYCYTKDGESVAFDARTEFERWASAVRQRKPMPESPF